MSLQLVNSALLLRETTLTNLPYTTGATNITVTDSSEFAENFTAGRHFNLVIWDKSYGTPKQAKDAGKLEVIRATAEPVANSIDITRGQEGTTPIEFSAGGDWKVSLMFTPEVVKELETNKANLAGGNSFTGLQRLVNGLNFNASGGDTLSKYVKGTWLPAWSFSSGSVEIDIQYARYERFGDIAIVRGRVRTTSTSSPTGNAILTGLPFTVSAGDSSPAGFIGFANAFAIDMPNLKIYSNNGTTTAQLQKNASNAGPALMTGTDFSTATSANQISFILIYRI